MAIHIEARCSNLDQWW